MDLKIVIVTGSNSDLGKAAVLKLDKKWLQVVMLCRKKTRGEQACQEIIGSIGNWQIEMITADPGSTESIHVFVDECNRCF